MLCARQQQQTECQSTVCGSTVACTAANQHPSHVQHNLPTLEQSLMKFLHLHPNQTLSADISEQMTLY